MSNGDEAAPQIILPAGTQVVTRIDICAKDGEVRRATGSVGTIIKCPIDASHAYLIRFPDGAEFSLKRYELSILKHSKGDFGAPVDHASINNLVRFVIYKCIVGSRAYGLDRDGSDTDYRGIYLPPADVHWSIYGVPEQLDMPETEECYWELQKFLVLALKANPNVLECLYSPLVETCTEIAAELLELRQSFLSKIVYQTFNGYVLSQSKKLEQDLRARQEIKWKHAMHLIRLLLSGVTILDEGYVPVRVDERHREALLAIRDGQMSWTSVNEWRLSLHTKIDEAFGRTKLPDRPDYNRVNQFLISSRRKMTLYA